MTTLDWSHERISWPEIVDLAPESEGIDLEAVRRYRQDRVREQMRINGIDAVVLSDAVNIRYACGARNMQIFSSRNAPSRYLLLTQDRSILFEFTGCEHLGDGFDTIDEVRASSTASYCAAGPDIATREIAWAAKMAGELRVMVGRGAKIGLERMNAGVAVALRDEGFTLADAQQPVETARSIKSTEEMKCVRASLQATEIAVGKLRDAITPGMTENKLWSVMWQSVIEQNGDYCETRLLNSGRRSNPWFQETSNHVIEPNVLVALDTDVVGCHGYYSDFSRTFHAGPDAPTAEQKTLYSVSYEQVQNNIGILHPGMTFREYSDKAWDIPDRFHKNRYYLSAHGLGMTGEYPYLYHHADFPDAGYNGEILPGMTLCVESYIGAEDGFEGVKLEEQVLITDDGVEVLSQFPFEDSLLS